MTKFFSIALAVVVGIVAADYVKEGAVEGLALSKQHICR